MRNESVPSDTHISLKRFILHKLHEFTCYRDQEQIHGSKNERHQVMGQSQHQHKDSRTLSHQGG